VIKSAMLPVTADTEKCVWDYRRQIFNSLSGLNTTDISKCRTHTST